MNLYKNWKPVFDIIEARLSLWKTSSLSIGGRVTLLQSVFENLPVYFFSLFKAPLRVIQKIDGIQRKILWGGNKNAKVINWVSWDSVTKPKAQGGLGLSPLHDFNLSLLSKWQWRFKNEEGKLWKNVLLSLHGNEDNQFIPKRRNATGVWKVISELDKEFLKKGFTLKESIIQKACNDNMIKWVWNQNKEGNFSVKAVRLLCSAQTQIPTDQVMHWNKLVPNKVNVLAWRIWLNKIPTKCALEKRNIRLPSILCSWCEESQEDTNHLFSGCMMAHKVWQEVGNWCSITPIIAFSPKDIINWFESVPGSKCKKLVVQAIMLITCWALWKARNKLVFDKKQSSVAEMIGDIKALSNLWIKHRAPAKWRSISMIEDLGAWLKSSSEDD